MAQSANNGVTSTQQFEDDAAENLLSYLRKAVSEYQDKEQQRVAQWLVRSSSTEDMVRRVGTLMRGSWKSDLALALSSVAGLGLGYVGGSLLPAGLGPIPYIAAIGLGGLLPGILTRQGLIVRNVFNLGGLMFSAGSVLGARS